MSEKVKANDLSPPPTSASSAKLDRHDDVSNSIEENDESGGGMAGEPNRQNHIESSDPKPKSNRSTFKITSVTIHEKGSSQDGLISLADEDDESAVDESGGPLENETDGHNHVNFDIKKQDRVDSNISRFKVVKIQKHEPYVVGRWKVSDYMSESDVSGSKITEPVNPKKGSESGNSSRSGSNHYIHGVDDPSKNPLGSILNSSSHPPLPVIQQSNSAQPPVANDSNLIKDTVAHTHNDLRSAVNNDNVLHDNDGKLGLAGNLQPAGLSSNDRVPGSISTSSVNPQSSSDNNSTIQANTQVQNVASSTNVPPTSLPVESQTHPMVNNSDEAHSTTAVVNDDELKSDGELCDAPETAADLGAALEEIVDTPGSDNQNAEDADATASGVAIDNKIEQAMDLVKSHLMLAVREEVEELKLQIKQLIERNNQLEQENKLLRSSAAPETLAQLTLLSRQQSHNSTK